MEFKVSDPRSVGIELELQLLDRETLDLRAGILPLMELFPGNPYVKPEYIQNTVEIASKVCYDIGALESHVKAIARELAAKANALGMEICAAGTHPFGVELALITPVPRYLRMEKEEGYISHTQITYATHVHLGMTSGDEAIALMRELKPYLPLLVALSASSPFWRGYDTRYASYRHRILAATRSYGIPPSFASWDAFCRFFDTARRAGVFETINDIHWDLRPRPHLGSLEVRVMDAQPTVADAVALAAFVRALVFYLKDTAARDRPTGLPPGLPWWLEKDNHYQASRSALAAKYVRDDEGTITHLADIYRCVAETIAPTARALEQLPYLQRLQARVDEGLSYQRQRRVYEKTASMRDVVESLVAELSHERAA